jgi:hypothetical protein
MLHVVKAHLLAGGVAERECFAAVLASLKAGIITQSQRFGLRISICISYVLDVAQLASMPWFIIVSNKLCHFGGPERKTQDIRICRVLCWLTMTGP